MKKLTLIRHAKSSWNNPINDFNRPIIEEGIQKTIKAVSYTHLDVYKRQDLKQ